ncbi:MAG: TrkA family potassium uptake protein [Eubacterium sp.]|nr:TrkA family potassium uptake protein [Eubacterium sp.]MDD7209531.1 TrkA family potassium uptake protein [Lachnospiraceae bacterium]MDY5498416.1 TrkA family potassium uptake protein [Anaerobutyricum sp.]
MKSILVIGMGILGQHLAAKMQELGNDVMIVDKDEAVIQKLSPAFKNSFAGDCTDEGVLRALGVNNFDYCFVAIGEDFYASLEITSILKELGAQYVISKAKRARQAEFLKKIGADEVFYPEREIAEKLAVRYNATNIFDYIPLTSEYSIFEIPILPEWIGKNIITIDVRNKFQVNIIAIKNQNHLMPVPGGHYTFKENDHIVVIGKSNDVFKLSSKTK